MTLLLSLIYTLLQYGSVPLEIAGRRGHTNIVQRLLDAGANVNHQDKVILSTYTLAHHTY